MRIFIRAPNGIFRKNSDAKNHRGVAYGTSLVISGVIIDFIIQRGETKDKKGNKTEKGEFYIYQEKKSIYTHIISIWKK